MQELIDWLVDTKGCRLHEGGYLFHEDGWEVAILRIRGRRIQALQHIPWWEELCDFVRAQGGKVN